MRFTIATVAAALLIPLSASAHPGTPDSYVPVPTAGGKSSPDLKIRFVRYEGGTNGEMVVVVRNDGKSKRTFSAEGIYFVPEGDPESAPQRLGAAGPFEMVKGMARHEANKLALAPGQSKRLYLSVFCIDSHRSSPSTGQKFKIAAKRMPRKLRQKISSGAAKAIKANRGNYKAPKTKSAIQSSVWKNRDADWIELQGERKAEKRPRHRKHPRPIQRRVIE